MKRTTSIFLLALIAAVSLRPMLALHFCGGKLHSVHYGMYLPEMSCCKSDNQQATGDRKDTRDTLPQNAWYGAVNACCANYNIALSTDNFRFQQEVATEVLPLVTQLSCLFTELTLSCGAGFSHSHNLPPGYPAPLSPDRLVRFCIFRI
ncbi:MAG: hypothetical protein LBS03_10140 [Bacteroidales bacterium]|jgi:hypothetical protein|nr:hypothetical protein [Bacteroidales bacterium]